MKKNNFGESLVGIVIGIFILSIVILAIASVIGYSNDLITKFDRKSTLDLLSSNSKILINKLDTSSLGDNYVFYIQKDNTAKQYKIHIGEQNNNYKFINKYGENINDINHYDGDVYTRIFYTKKFGDKLAIKAMVKRLIK